MNKKKVRETEKLLAATIEGLPDPLRNGIELALKCGQAQVVYSAIEWAKEQKGELEYGAKALCLYLDKAFKYSEGG